MRKQVAKTGKYTIDGDAVDQMTIINHRPIIEEWVRDKVFDGKPIKTKLFWNMKEDTTFEFYLECELDDVVADN